MSDTVEFVLWLIAGVFIGALIRYVVYRIKKYRRTLEKQVDAMIQQFKEDGYILVPKQLTFTEKQALRDAWTKHYKGEIPDGQNIDP